MTSEPEMTIRQRFENKERNWNDWRWQLHNRITSAEQIAQLLRLTPQHETKIAAVLKEYRMSITPYYLSLINPTDPHCPIARQCIPEPDELKAHPDCCSDPLDEDKYTPIAGVVHKHPDRALLICTSRCSVYCRHCTRRRYVVKEKISWSVAAGSRPVKAAIDYISQHPSIREVIVTGGDPLVHGDARIEALLERLRSIPHVQILRIGTRVPVVLPMRITQDLVQMLRQFQPVWINTQFNHPREITPESIDACSKIVDAGIPLGNQTVLLRGINDSSKILGELFQSLIRIRVRPYYLYQCDPVQGIGHFRTHIDDGVKIMKQLRKSISGLAVPTFVQDTREGKIPLY